MKKRKKIQTNKHTNKHKKKKKKKKKKKIFLIFFVYLHEYQLWQY